MSLQNISQSHPPTSQSLMSLQNISQSHPPNISKCHVPSEHQPVTPTQSQSLMSLQNIIKSPSPQSVTIRSQNTIIFVVVTCFNIKMYQKLVIKHNFNCAWRQHFCLSETSEDEIFFWLLNWTKICLLTLRNSLIHSIHLSLTHSLIYSDAYTYKQLQKLKNLHWVKKFISFKCLLEIHLQYGKYLVKYLPYDSTDPCDHRMRQSLYRPHWIRVTKFCFMDLELFKLWYPWCVFRMYYKRI